MSGCGLLLMELDGLRVDTVLQHPALVVVRAQAELALLVRVHGIVVRKPRLVAMSRLPSRAHSNLSPRISFWRLLTPLEDTFACPVALSSM